MLGRAGCSRAANQARKPGTRPRQTLVLPPLCCHHAKHPARRGLLAHRLNFAQVVVLGAGSIIGDMSLQAGAKRSATVVALTDLATFKVRTCTEFATQPARKLRNRRATLFHAALRRHRSWVCDL